MAKHRAPFLNNDVIRLVESHRYLERVLCALPFNFLTFSFANFSIVLEMDKVTSGAINLDNVSSFLYVECDNEAFLYFDVSVIFFPFTQYRILM